MLGRLWSLLGLGSLQKKMGWRRVYSNRENYFVYQSYQLQLTTQCLLYLIPSSSQDMQYVLWKHYLESFIFINMLREGSPKWNSLFLYPGNFLTCSLYYGVHCSTANTHIILQSGPSPVLRRLGILMSINRHIAKVKKLKKTLKLCDCENGAVELLLPITFGF